MNGSRPQGEGTRLERRRVRPKRGGSHVETKSAIRTFGRSLASDSGSRRDAGRASCQVLYEGRLLPARPMRPGWQELRVQHQELQQEQLSKVIRTSRPRQRCCKSHTPAHVGKQGVGDESDCNGVPHRTLCRGEFLGARCRGQLLASPNMRPLLTDIAPDFEGASGHTLVVVYDSPARSRTAWRAASRPTLCSHCGQWSMNSPRLAR